MKARSAPGISSRSATPRASISATPWTSTISRRWRDSPAQAARRIRAQESGSHGEQAMLDACSNANFRRPAMAIAAQRGMTAREWGLLALLSLLWGGSFFFVGVAVREVPPLTLVALRVGLAAALLWACAPLI